MPGAYSFKLSRTASLALSLGTMVVQAGTPRRFGLVELELGSEANPPQDFAFQYQVQRSTTGGTGTSVTPNANDPADPAALIDVLENLTVDPTLTAGALPLTIDLNQRSTFRWVARPGGEILAPATAANGFALRTPVAGALVLISASVGVQQF